LSLPGSLSFVNFVSQSGDTAFPQKHSEIAFHQYTGVLYIKRFIGALKRAMTKRGFIEVREIVLTTHIIEKRRTMMSAFSAHCSLITEY
jgi:hypothetical protein